MSNKVYQGYYYTDRDPVLDEINTVIANAKVTPAQLHEVACYGEGKQVSTSTVYNWRDKTKSPQHRTLAAVAHALGYRLALTRFGESVVSKKALEPAGKAKGRIKPLRATQERVANPQPEWRLKALRKARRVLKAKRKAREQERATALLDQRLGT